MSKKIHTIQSSDKNEFDEKVNNLLGIGCELLKNTYEVIKNDDDVIYSQVIEYDTKKTNIRFYNNGQIDIMGMLDIDGKRVGIYTSWYENGQKMSECSYKDGELHGLLTEWYRNGQKEFEGTWKDGGLDGLVTKWDHNGRKRREETYKDGNIDESVTKFWNKDGSVDKFGQSLDSLQFKSELGEI